MPGPRIELKELDVFLGHWSCKGQVAASPMCPARSNESDVKIERALGGYWLALDLHEKKSARSP
ncbi:MAG: hypothetical protein IPK07_09430 [Deltaproteobacteria bacterium]|nr:hypothetical protein [Deltaproteobacteria bacterium]